MEACVEGPFKLEIDGGMSVFKSVRPNLIQISSASTERNAVIGDDAAARAADIPIVQLNPGGVLNWKYKGETAVRASGLNYVVLRPTGLLNDKDPDEDAQYCLEFSQGDMVAGRVSRPDLAAVVVQAAAEPAAVNATFELTRGQRWTVGGKQAFDGTVPKYEWLKLVPDKDRRKRGLRPIPAYVPAPPPVPEERKKEILADPRVLEQQARDAPPAAPAAPEASPVATVASGAADTAISLQKAAVKQWVAGYRERSARAAVAQWIAGYRERTDEAAVSEAADAQGDDIGVRKADVQAWVSAWRQKSEVRSWIANWRAASASAAAAGDASPAVAKAEAQAWIANWRAGPESLGNSVKVEKKVESREPVKV